MSSSRLGSASISIKSSGEKRFGIDAFIVPVRDLVEAATSRVVLEQRSIHQHNPWMADRLDKTWETYGHTAGGLVYSLNPLDQARLLAVQFHRLVLKASEAGIPIVFPVFPRIATDWEYLHKCLRPILPRDISEDAGRAAHASVADAAKIRVTREIFKGAPGNAAYRRQPRPEPHYPKPDRGRQHRASARNQPGFGRTNCPCRNRQRKRRTDWRLRFRSCGPRRLKLSGRERALTPPFDESGTSSSENQSSTK